MIKLKIIRFAENPQYEEEQKEYKDAQKFNRSFNGCDGQRLPQKLIEQTSAEIMITSEQFEAIRKEVLKSF